jgi:hypothetical protein
LEKIDRSHLKFIRDAQQIVVETDEELREASRRVAVGEIR